MIRLINFFLLIVICADASILISAGGFDVKKEKESYSFSPESKIKNYANITEVLQKRSKHTNSVAIWITKDWQEEWYDPQTTQKEIINKGYTPMFIFYWFGDEISPKYVKKHKECYFETLREFSKYLQKLDGQKIVVLNPEYNMGKTGSWKPMNDIFLKSYKILRDADKQVIVGPCVGDFGNYKYIDEPNEWKLFHKSLYKAVKKADFIAFQEMRALTKNSPADIERTARRAYHFAKYLHKKYKKPTLLSYVAISSYGNNGEKIQAQAYKNFIKYLPKMEKEAKLMLFGTFHYFDYPGHVGYFKEAEEFFGLLRKDGTKKPAFKYYNKLK
jgi:hypothetical protein